jgi:hypothetical protein
VAFVTLCEAYLGIDPEFNLWNYLFCVRCPQDSEVELMVSGGVIIHAKSGIGVGPYLKFTMLRSMNGGKQAALHEE